MIEKTLTLKPIGTIATPFLAKYDAPRQPASAAQKSIGIITLNARHNFEQALEDLKEFDYIWILFWFDRNSSWKPKVSSSKQRQSQAGTFRYTLSAPSESDRAFPVPAYRYTRPQYTDRKSGHA